MINCQLCNQANKTTSGLGRHVSLTHKMKMEDYYFQFLKKNEKEGFCKICNKRTNFRNISEGFLTYCSSKCANLDPIVRQKSINTYLEKTGYEHNMYNPESRKKIKQTNLNRYGVEYAIRNDKIKEKLKQTNLNRYGVEHASQTEWFKEKLKQTNLEKFGVDNYFKSKEFIKKNSELTRERKEKLFKERFVPNGYELISYEKGLDVILKCPKQHIFKEHKHFVIKRIAENYEVCSICKPKNSFGQQVSKSEKDILRFIKKIYEGKIIENCNNLIKPYELDIYLPDLNLAIEYNGLIYHSELYKDKNYHLMKTEKCLKKNVQLIHIFEDDWIYKIEIVKNRLKSLIGLGRKLYARKCIVKEIDNETIEKFLENNHIQGYVKSSINIGLFYNEELVSIMTFGKTRFEKKYEWELLRFCNSGDLNVVGAAGKLLKYFENKYNPKSLISYADRSWSKGNLYDKIGFELLCKTTPNYFYIVDGIRMGRFRFRKSELIKDGFDKDKTEHEIMLERKLYRIYNSGNLKFVKEY